MSKLFEYFMINITRFLDFIYNKLQFWSSLILISSIKPFNRFRHFRCSFIALKQKWKIFVNIIIEEREFKRKLTPIMHKLHTFANWFWNPLEDPNYNRICQQFYILYHWSCRDNEQELTIRIWIYIIKKINQRTGSVAFARER